MEHRIPPAYVPSAGAATTPVGPDTSHGRTPSGGEVDVLEARTPSVRQALAADDAPATPLARLSEREVERADGKAASSAAGVRRDAVLEKMEALSRRHDAGHESATQRAGVVSEARALYATAVAQKCLDAARPDDCAALAVLARLADDGAVAGHLEQLGALLAAQAPEQPSVLLGVAALMDKLAPLWDESARGDMYRLLRPAMLAAGAAIAKEGAEATTRTADMLRSVYALREVGLRIVLMSAMREHISDERFNAAVETVFSSKRADAHTPRGVASATRQTDSKSARLSADDALEIHDLAIRYDEALVAAHGSVPNKAVASDAAELLDRLAKDLDESNEPADHAALAVLAHLAGHPDAPRVLERLDELLSSSPAGEVEPFKAAIGRLASLAPIKHPGLRDPLLRLIERETTRHGEALRAAGEAAIGQFETFIEDLEEHHAGMVLDTVSRALRPFSD